MRTFTISSAATGKVMETMVPHADALAFLAKSHTPHTALIDLLGVRELVVLDAYRIFRVS